jgi:hypothetical protein
LKLALNKNSNKVLAYQLDYDIFWDLGLPPKSDPSYKNEALKTERAESRRIGLRYDAWLVEYGFPKVGFEFCYPPPPGYRVFCQGRPNTDLPEPVPFVGLIAYLLDLDYPYNDHNWPIVSPGMLEALKSVGDFRHNTYSTIIDDASNDDPPGVNESFLILQTLEFLDAFDLDKSEYVMDSEVKGYVYKVSKMVLKEPLEGFPPMFRLNVRKDLLFVSAAAKEALEAAGADRGIDFIPVDENYSW